MRLTAVVRIALRALARHKLRSALTVLGVSIGVGAFIGSVAVGEGAARQIQDQIRSLGDNMIWIEAGGRNVSGVRTGTHGTRSLTQGDARAIEEQVLLVTNVSPNVDTHATVVYRNQNWFTQVRGVTPNYLPVRHWEVERGGPFSQADVEYAAKVCLLGHTVAANLFGADDPVGETIRVQKLPMGICWVDDIFCSAVSPTAMGAAEREITALLRERHHVLAGQADDFNLRHPVEIVKAGAAPQRTMTWLLGSIASVALLVGGIGIMNIMLVSVAERTREIGIRMAVGAKERDIRAQFLVEAVTLSLIGGGMGVGLGLLGAYGITAVVQWQTRVGADAIAAALACAGAVGIFFGFYPARRAARLDPIEALRR